MKRMVDNSNIVDTVNEAIESGEIVAGGGTTIYKHYIQLKQYQTQMPIYITMYNLTPIAYPDIGKVITAASNSISMWMSYQGVAEEICPAWVDEIGSAFKNTMGDTIEFSKTSFIGDTVSQL